MKKLTAFLSIITLLVYACTSTGPYHSTNKLYKKQAKELTQQLRQLPAASPVNPAAYPAGTVNFNLRKPNYVIIHHTAQDACEKTVRYFTQTKAQVSAHYVICKDGTVHHMLNDYLRAWHGGIAKWGSVTDINSVSLGIELDNNGSEAFPASQISSLIALLANIKKTYNIPASNFIGHADIAPPRKQDPNANFPWKELAQNGFGHWPDQVLDTVPPNFNHLQALRLIGYDTKDSTAAIIAFKRHFIQTDLSPALSPEQKSILSNLLNKY